MAARPVVWMIVQEVLAKRLIADYGVRVPRGRTAATPEAAADVAAWLGGEVVLKAQIPTGRRGKAGAIGFALGPQEAADEAQRLLGAIVNGHTVSQILVEERVEIEREMYAAVLNDVRSQGPLVLFCDEGGMDIEELHAAFPEHIRRQEVDIRHGLDPGQAQHLAEASGLDQVAATAAARALLILYQVYREFDADLLEVNPLALTRKGELLALDCKLRLDPGARPRHPDVFMQAEALLPPEGTALERRARELGLLYIELEGEVGVLANGAGLTMATMDVITHYGGRPANFLEIGGANYTQAAPALELVLSNPRVRSLLVNFCGAFARTDVMTEGVIMTLERLERRLPVFFSVHGTGREEAIALLRERLGIEPFESMDGAVRAAIEAAEAGSDLES